MQLFLVCDAAPAADPNSVTNPANINVQFLTGAGRLYHYQRAVSITLLFNILCL